jgi:hypothetical protein
MFASSSPVNRELGSKLFSTHHSLLFLHQVLVKVESWVLGYGTFFCLEKLTKLSVNCEMLAAGFRV